ncbi:MAG: cupin domain-containing protein [Myxococcota bacterium]
MADNARPPVALVAADAAPRAISSNYPEPFASRMAGRVKRPLGDPFGIRSFGVNRTTLAPGAMTALRHAHTVQDELVYVLEGQPTLVTDAGETPLAPGMCAGFRAGSGDGHHLVNRTDSPVVILEIGDRQPGDTATYPDDDIAASQGPDGRWRFAHKDGTPY